MNISRNLFVLLLSAGCSSAAPVADAATVPQAAVHAETAPVVEENPGYVGVLIPSAALDVAPTYEGKLDKVHVKVGQWVAQGTAIATFDPASAQEALRMARAELRSAKGQAAEAAAMARHASRTLRTERELFNEGITAAQTVDKARADRMRSGAATMSAAGQVGAAKARVEQLERQLEETDLAAPFSGQIAIVYRDNGAVADPARPVARLIDTSKTFVRFALPPSESAKVPVGARVDVLVDWLGEPMTATIREVSPEVDAPTGLIFAEAEIASGDIAHVKPHSPAWVRLKS